MKSKDEGGKNAGSSGEEIRHFYEREDFENYTIKVHALKSSARLVGAVELSELAAKLEACGNLIR